MTSIRLGRIAAVFELGKPTEAEDSVNDHRSTGQTLGRHLLAMLRPVLREQRLRPAATLNTYRDGRLARACGMVTRRQRPGTANGAMFVTLEDETGNVNVIVWQSVLAVYGT